MPDIHWVIARRRHLAQIAVNDATFNESDHPRKDDGQFGSGGSSAASESGEGAKKKSTSKVGFVAKALEDHGGMAGFRRYLSDPSNISTGKIAVALNLLDKAKSQGHNDPDTSAVYKALEKEHNERAGSGR